MRTHCMLLYALLRIGVVISYQQDQVRRLVAWTNSQQNLLKMCYVVKYLHQRYTQQPAELAKVGQLSSLHIGLSHTNI